ncbi:hypothetical protein VTO73DRAFT_11287 [Trametes versicolor]
MYDCTPVESTVLCDPILQQPAWSLVLNPYASRKALLEPPPLFVMRHLFASFLDNWYPRHANTPATGSGLEALPIEILEIIFQFACTDGGRTGCNLSLVSKYIRATSRAYRFHAVSMLAGISIQLDRLLSALKAAQAEARAEGGPMPRVRNLCILLTPALYPPGDLGFKTTDLDRAIRQHQKALVAGVTREGHVDHNFRIFKVYYVAFRKLFAAVHADLETLCLFRRCYSSYPATPLIPCPRGFPRLREFTFNEDLPPFAPPTDGTPMYPALKRLHMTLLCEDAEVGFPWWAANAPQLGWLRINTVHRVAEFDVRIVSQLAHVLGPDLDGRRTRHPSAPVPSFDQLNTLMLMISPIFRLEYPPPPPVASAYVASATALDAELRALGVPHTVFQPHYSEQDIPKSSRFPQLEEGMRCDWLLRLGGEEGLFTPEFWTRPLADPEMRVPGTLESLRDLWKVVWAAGSNRY